ncbi:MAG: DNA-directed RNA polymerase subunit delta [Bacilli bacterium]|nr:DNA-directed RNA polymerase subunit delta [Bacilli bacterium]MDD4298115.1 DNA-directed RNA polymerase subunit delta [Bacilli bacterium]
MNIREMEKDELEPLSFNDIAYYIIKLDKEPKTTVMLFKEICTLLEMSDSEYEALIADFFTSLTTDKRFILLNSSNWDLKENHVVNIIVDESEEDFDPLYEELEETDDIIEADESLEADDVDELSDDAAIDDEDTDEFEDLQIIDEDAELEE